MKKICLLLGAISIIVLTGCGRQHSDVNKNVIKQLKAEKVENQQLKAQISELNSKKSSDNQVDVNSGLQPLFEGFIEAMFNVSGNTLQAKYEAEKPYLTGNAVDTLKPDSRFANQKNTDDGASGTTISNIRVYSIIDNAGTKEVLTRFNVRNKGYGNDVTSAMLLDTEVTRINGKWKISEYKSISPFTGDKNKK